MRGQTCMGKRIQGYLAALGTLAGLGLSAGPAQAITYTTGDVVYVAYKTSGSEYIVNLGSKDNLLTATTTLSFPHVSATDVNSLLGSNGPNIFVTVFAIQNTATRDGILTLNGPKNLTETTNTNVIGAGNAINNFGVRVPVFGTPVPGNTDGASYPGPITNSYQASMNASFRGSLASNTPYDVETRLSDGSGIRISTPVNIPFYSGQRNPGTGLLAQAVIGFFRLFPDGTITFSRDADGDFIPDDIDKCPGLSNPNNTDADSDGRAVPCDCNDGDATSWSAPGDEAQDLTFTSLTAFNWLVPADPGGNPIKYDIFRSSVATGTMSCLTPDLLGTSSTDGTSPAPGVVQYYIVRPQTTCGAGPSGTTRALATCP